MEKNDGETWSRKHKRIHEIQNLLRLSNRATANLLSVPEKDLNEIIQKLVECGCKEEKKPSLSSLLTFLVEYGNWIVGNWKNIRVKDIEEKAKQLLQLIEGG